MHINPFLAIGLVIFSGLSSTAGGQSPTPLFYSEAALVPVTVTVEQSNGAYVTDLPASSFRVFDEGVARPISTFGAGNDPVDLLLLLDTSASLTERLPTMQGAATRLVRSLRPRDRAMLLTFGASTNIVQPFTSDVEVLTRAIAALSCEGTTSLYDALYVALSQFRPPDKPVEMRRRTLVVFSDGDDTASLISYEMVGDAARRRAVATYTVRLVSPFQTIDGFDRAAYELRDLARDTGARSFTATGERDVAAACEAIAADLSHQYVLGFIPPDEPRSRFHRIAVVVSGPHSAVRARAGYISARPR